MSVNFDVEKINTALEDFNNATGIHIDLRGADFSPISYCEFESNDYCNLIQSTKKGKKACSDSDFCLLSRCQKTKCTETHVCHAGLVDISVPIVFEDEIIGYLIFGQMRRNTDSKPRSEYLEALGLDPKKLEELYNSIPLFDSVRINSVSNIAVMLVKFILFQKLLKPDLNENIQRAITYINENLESDLSVKSVSENSNISKSVLYKKFHLKFRCTVSEYINKKRIEKSMKLLSETDMSVEEISQKVGFSSASYYSKTFKKHVGVSPLKYRKSKSELDNIMT